MEELNINLKPSITDDVAKRVERTVEDGGVVTGLQRPSWIKNLYSTLILKTK